MYEAWTNPDLMQRWWVPKSFGASFLSCETDVRTGGAYRFVFSHPSSEKPMTFFGKYLEVVPESRLVWTNDEGGENGAITTVTFEESDGETLVVTRDVYSSRKALDAASLRELRVDLVGRSSNWTYFLSTWAYPRRGGL